MRFGTGEQMIAARRMVRWVSKACLNHHETAAISVASNHGEGF